jgi:hypothetical protein
MIIFGLVVLVILLLMFHVYSLEKWYLYGRTISQKYNGHFFISYDEDWTLTATSPCGRLNDITLGGCTTKWVIKKLLREKIITGANFVPSSI